MGACVMQGQAGTGASVTWANAEGGIVFSREDSIAGTTPIPIPTVTGTNFSWYKNLVLYVTSTGTTTISNRRVYQSGAASTGLALFWEAVAVASYVQASGSNKPTDSGSNGATPAGYTAMTTSPVQYDNASVSSGSTGPNGKLIQVVLGCDTTYGGGPGSAISLPSCILEYDEQ